MGGQRGDRRTRPQPVKVLAFHKPYGVVTQFSGESPNLADFVSVKGVYAAGRLDKDSEGLLILTNDGALIHHLTDPKYDHTKTYWVQVEGIPSEEALDQLRRGVTVQGYTTRPALVERLENPAVPEREPPIRFRQSIPTSWLAITLTEGKNRQVRRMTAAVGHPTLRLIRTWIGKLALGQLGVGVWRELSPGEIALLRQSGRSR